MKVLEFHEFCPKVLHLDLTVGQSVVAKIAFGNYDPVDLNGAERDLAVQMFGGLERVSQSSRKYVLLRLGRGSGKTTLCSAYATYTAVTADVSMCGPGDVPYVVVVAPDRPSAQLSVRMAREMIRSQPALERLIVSDTADAIELRRPDGRMVRIEAFAASRGGSSVRGRTILGFIMDEAEFFTSNAEGVRDYSINDKDLFRALKPRLVTSGKGMLISTPWPTETLMGEMFEANWGKCISGCAIKAPTLLVRGDDPSIKTMVEDELQKDPENARRELFCELDGFRGGEFFDTNALTSSIDGSCQEFPMLPNGKWPVAVGCDLGFTRDSSAIAVVQYDGTNYITVYLEEMRPSIGRPLQPSSVIRKFAEVSKRYGAKGVIADTYYREALKEQLKDHGLTVWNAPEGTSGKAQVFQRTRAVLHEGFIRLPESPLCRRLINQAKLVTSKAAPGGTTMIKVPRKIGLGHGDLVSAWVLAVHELATAKITEEKPVFDMGTPEWFNESQRRMVEYHEKQQKDYLKGLEKEEKGRMSKRRYWELFDKR